MPTTSPDNLPYPTDYSLPADIPQTVEDLAVATQAALNTRPTKAVVDAQDATKLPLTGGRLTGVLYTTVPHGVVARNVSVFTSSGPPDDITAGGTFSATYQNDRMGLWLALDGNDAGGPRADLYVHRLYTYAMRAAETLPVAVRDADTGSIDVAALLGVLLDAVTNLPGGPQAVALALEGLEVPE